METFNTYWTIVKHISFFEQEPQSAVAIISILARLNKQKEEVVKELIRRKFNVIEYFQTVELNEENIEDYEKFCIMSRLYIDMMKY